MRGQAAPFDDQVHRRLVDHHRSENGGFFFRQFGDFCGGFRHAGFAGEGELAEVVEQVAGWKKRFSASSSATTSLKTPCLTTQKMAQFLQLLWSRRNFGYMP